MREKKSRSGIPVLCVIKKKSSCDLNKSKRYDEPENLSLPSKICKSYIDIGIIKINDSRYEEAIEALNNAVEVDETQPLAYNLRGLAKKEIEDYKGALKDFNKAVELDSEDFDFYFNRANIKSTLGDSLGAIKDYLLAIFYKNEYPYTGMVDNK